MSVSIWEGSKAQDLINAILQTKKIDSEQGVSSAGKVMGVGDDGLVSPVELALSTTLRSALLDCLEHVAWADENGSTYYHALLTALANNPIIFKSSATPGMEIVYSVTNIRIGIGTYTTNHTYAHDSTLNTNATGNTMSYVPKVGDIIRIADPLKKFKFNVGTGVVASSSDGHAYRRGESAPDDYIVVNEGIQDLKTILVRKVDGSAFTSSDINLLNGITHVYRAVQ